ncbi:MAG: Mur ligase family protein [Candidatus Paceibacterota bacterium]
MKLEELRNKKILILGFGREGIDTFSFLRKLFPNKVLGIADKSEKIKKPGKKTVLHLGKNYLEAIKKYDLVVKSPGIPFGIIPKSSFGKLTSQTKIFFDNCPGEIVGITGTKGKSTTTALIYNILKEGGKKAYLVGNIGKPVLNLLSSASSKDIYVYELSSHQLYNLKKSPHIAVFLNVFPEHLDYYKDIKEYSQAKSNITLHQGKDDYLVYNSGDKIVSSFAAKSKAKKIPIKGKYYELDKTAARKVGEIFGISETKIEKAIKNFKPLPHRLELVGKFKGITFYNDALSTIPETAIFALDYLGKNVETIMLGGFDRNIDFKNLAKRIVKSDLKNLVLFPTTGEKIWREVALLSKNKFKPFFTDNMEDAVKLAYKYTKTGKICLLSCASTSFSIFKDYEEKGNLFKKYVKKFGKK